LPDATEFQDIYSLYYPKIVRYLARIVGEGEAEDVAQDVFVKVHAALGGFRGESSMSTWIYRIATNAGMDHIRSRASRQGPNDELRHDIDDLEAVQDAAPPADTFLIRKDMNECIQGIVKSLPDNYRTVLVLSDLEGLTNAEIGEVLGLSLDTAKIRLHRARARLKKELESQCNFYHDGRNELACDRKIELKRF
jgi:RNA polymerase sigma-70 factor (ECF subfamily)